MIEIVVAIAILAMILGLGLFISLDFAKSYNFRSERSTIVSILQKARGESINNIGQTRHGVRFESSPLKYIIFECPSVTPQCTSYTAEPTDSPIDSSYGISVTNPSLPFNVIFNQLDGTTNSTSIVVNDGTKSYTISVNSEGRIDW